MKTIEEQVKNYTDAKFISMDKMLGQGGVVFYEFRNKDGVIENIPHVALPILTKDHPRFFALVEEIEELKLQATDKLQDLQQKLEELKKSLSAENKDKISEKEISKQILAVMRDMNKVNTSHINILNNKRLEIAVLCLKRTEPGVTVESVSEWIDNSILDKLEQIAAGITIPPK